MTRDLKHCPFCGNAAAWCDEHHKDEPHECHHIVCTACDAEFDMSGNYNPETLDELKDYCGKRFNTRAEQASQPDGAIVRYDDGTDVYLDYFAGGANKHGEWAELGLRFEKDGEITYKEFKRIDTIEQASQPQEIRNQALDEAANLIRNAAQRAVDKEYHKTFALLLMLAGDIDKLKENPDLTLINEGNIEQASQPPEEWQKVLESQRVEIKRLKAQVNRLEQQVIAASKPNIIKF